MSFAVMAELESIDMPINKALHHMHIALRLLDDAGASDSALRLQYAIDITEGAPPLQMGDPHAELIDRWVSEWDREDADRYGTDRQRLH